MLPHMGDAMDVLVLADSPATTRTGLTEHPVRLALVGLGLPDGHGVEPIEELRIDTSGCPRKERDDMEVGLASRGLLRGGVPIKPFIARHHGDHPTAGHARGAKCAQAPDPAPGDRGPAQREIAEQPRI